MDTLLEIKDLEVEFDIEGRTLKAVDGVSFDIKRGVTTGLVGESGCGKSVTAYSIMRLIPNPPGRIKGGHIFYNGKDIFDIPIDEMSKIRGKEIAMIFQEPMTALNPVYTVGNQITEIFKLHYDYSQRQMYEKATDMLRMVGIPSTTTVMKSYPHQLSGGMRQRVMIAMALSCSPKLLIADEPTTALDVTIQAQIIDLINKLKSDFNASILFITHDLSVIAQTCDDVAVMYAGKIVERADVFELFEKPMHPYTRGLIDSIPKRGVDKKDRLQTIEGMVPDLFTPPRGCRFADRCFRCKAICKDRSPELKKIGEREVACHFPL